MSDISGDDFQNVTVLQNIDDSILSGRKECMKDYLHSRDIENIKKTASKSMQANLDRYIWDKELSNEEPSKNFWKVEAEKKRVALSKALSDNEELHNCIDDLTKENMQYKDKLEEANIFIEVCKEFMEENGGDTGIDVGDLSEFNCSTEN